MHVLVGLGVALVLTAGLSAFVSLSAVRAEADLGRQGLQVIFRGVVFGDGYLVMCP